MKTDPIERPWWERTEDVVIAPERDNPWFACQTCGKLALNTGHWPYCSWTCECASKKGWELSC